MSNEQYKAPNGPPPPTYPPQAYNDAGPYYPPGSPSPNMQNQIASYPPQNEYGQWQAQPYQQQGPPPQGYYGQQGPMYYQQQGPPQGYYADNRGYSGGYGGGGYGYQQPYRRGAGSAAEGICAGLLGALACCCCLDFLF